MTNKELLDCLTDRPCAVCKFHEEKGCTKWDCVFDQREQEPCREQDDYENEIEDLHNRLDIAEYDKERLREEVTEFEEKIKALEQELKTDIAKIDEDIQDYKDTFRSRGKTVDEALDDVLDIIDKYRQAEQEPCDLCKYNPPSSADGKPCGMCPAEKKVRDEMTYCTCWVEYPNKSHLHKNGKWKCIDNYKCIRPLKTIPLQGLPFPKYVCKTKCERIDESEG